MNIEGAGGFSRLSRAESMLSFPFEERPAPFAASEKISGRHVLEELFLAALDGPDPCFVMFSGGRDSSAMLAIGVHVARREGLPEPVPVIARHRHVPESDETAWQEMVLEHLGISNPIVRELDGEQQVLGDIARFNLRRHGLLWPESMQMQGAVFAGLGPGALVTGEGGDFIIDGLRMGEMRSPFHRGRPHRREVRRAWRAARPRSIDRWAKPPDYSPTWLTGPGRETFHHAVSRLSGRRFRWDRQVAEIMASPASLVVLDNLDGVVREYGLVPHRTIGHPRFVQAWARDGGPFGFTSRTAAFRFLVGDLLPDAVTGRTSKASFNGARWGAEEDEFARQWDGSGIDPEWVDRDALRADWLSPDRHAAADYLVHVAWCAQNGIPAEGLASREGSAA